ncbi:hypothetical protein [Corynebacterium sp. HMSC072A04]|uniref:hypothetical protein n=1 Tax=Corynebacterium sp. HMSC072A04 TaxID=1715045 RepID=UPI00114CF5BE|nr:hypothetical protein [Corynebacterium sp. HMSC072A04]
MGDVDYRLVDELNEKQQALEDREAAARRREAALRMPPLPSGHRDPIGPRTDAPDKAWGGARRG